MPVGATPSPAAGAVINHVAPAPNPKDAGPEVGSFGVNYVLPAVTGAVGARGAGGAAEASAGASGRAIPGLAQLPMDVAVPINAGEAIPIPRALAPSEMAALTNTTGNIEFSQTFANGQFWLTRADFATPNLVEVLPRAPGMVWLSHSHPAGYSGMPSPADRLILRQLGQDASRVVRPDGSSVRFGP
ncbi:MAG: hypothetical protein KC657_39670, partial [Myxococcales bacterium]|nr:hypothetical protein [Myxococcales bacterium]